MNEQDIRADERKRIAKVFEQVAALPDCDPDRQAIFLELAKVLRADREELIHAGLIAIADEIIAEQELAERPS